jgi:hypothetical protein
MPVHTSLRREWGITEFTIKISHFTSVFINMIIQTGLSRK